jgi:hypothetical protein
MKLKIDEDMWNGFDFYYFFFKIKIHSSFPLKSYSFLLDQTGRFLAGGSLSFRIVDFGPGHQFDEQFIVSGIDV